MHRPIGALETDRAAAWNWGENIINIETPRHPFTEPLQKIVGQTINKYVQQGSTIVEIGAGSGYLKELLPVEHQPKLISTDYNPRNLQAGQQRRTLQAVAASAYELPLSTASVDTVISLDAFDTFPSFDKAFGETWRVLKPGGNFMHFQINNPSEDMLEIDYPGTVWLPQPNNTDFTRRATGVDRHELQESLQAATMVEAWRELMQLLIEEPGQRLGIEYSTDGDRYAEIAEEIITDLGLSQTIIPSVFEYFRGKLGTAAIGAGLQIRESKYQKESVPVKTPSNLTEELVMGRRVQHLNSGIVSNGGPWRAASMLVFVAGKA